MPLRVYARQGTATLYLRGSVRIGKRRITVYESAGTEDAALAEIIRATREAELVKELALGKSRAVPFHKCALSYLAWEPRGRRDKKFVAALIAHFAGMVLTEIGQDAADAAVKAIVSDDAAPATKIREVYTPLAAILNFGADRQWCDRQKFRHPSVPRSPTRFLTPSEAGALIAAAAAHLRPLLIFLLCTGARTSEALELDWADVDLGAERCRFRDTKNGTDRIAALTPAAMVALAGMPHREGAVFRTDNGEPYSDKDRDRGGRIKTAWATACRRAQVHNAKPHDLRHTWATYLYALTKDPMLVKHEGGWKSLEMVERYAHLLPSALVPAIRLVWGNTHPIVGELPRAPAVHGLAERPASI